MQLLKEDQVVNMNFLTSSIQSHFMRMHSKNKVTAYILDFLNIYDDLSSVEPDLVYKI